MSTLTILALIALAIDSIVVMFAVYKQKWALLAICVTIGALLDLLIIKTA